ncbi:MAG TPA: hypothetical protein VH062_20485 [Polyangiaceae bacterium]|nr:hypothetical protein [Polyangiaceae bacterium]
MVPGSDHPAIDAGSIRLPSPDAAQKAKIDPEAKRCVIDQSQLGMLKRRLDEEMGPRRRNFETPVGPKTWGDFVEQSEENVRQGRPA